MADRRPDPAPPEEVLADVARLLAPWPTPGTEARSAIDEALADPLRSRSVRLPK